MVNSPTGSEPEAVIPPPPVVPQAPPSGLPPLAPPLGGAAPTPQIPQAPPWNAGGAQPIPPAPPHGVGAAPTTPPYAPAQYPATAPTTPYAGATPTTPPYAAGYPASTYPMTPPPRSGNRTGLILAIVGGVLVLALAGGALLVGLFIANARPETVGPVPQATPEAVSPAPSEPSTAPPPPVLEGTGIGAQLEAKIEEYKGLRESGALWDRIPDTDFNQTAVVAFLLLLTDMKSATAFGVDAAKETEYAERMALLEERLLAEEPLGSDINITFSSGRTFTYDGETGEGGYSEE